MGFQVPTGVKFPPPLKKEKKIIPPGQIPEYAPVGSVPITWAISYALKCLYRDAEEDEDLEAAGEVSSDSDEDSDDNLMEVDDDTDSDFEMIVAERRRRESERELQMELERERSEPEGGLVRLPISEKKLVFMFVYKDDLSSDQFLERVRFLKIRLFFYCFETNF